jgi:hypothetical protein
MRSRGVIAVIGCLIVGCVVAATRADAASVPLPGFFLRNSNSTGVADIALGYGDPGDIPLAGNWDGVGGDSIGVYRPSTSTFYLRNSNSSGYADVSFVYGNPGDIPLVGNWDGVGGDSIGVYRPSTSTFYLRNSNSSGFADVSLTYGNPGDMPLAGDWDGDHRDTVGVYRPSTGTFFLSNFNPTGVPDQMVRFGNLGDVPLVGDWNGDGLDTIGVSRGTSFFLRSSTDTSGVADLAFSFGDPGDAPVAGDWNGDGVDTIGIQRQPSLPSPFDPFRGLGSWADVYDWSVTHGGNPPPFSLASVDHMADEGVQTLYIQPVTWTDASDILEQDRVSAIILRAHERGMRVVGWYLPDLRDINNDMRHLIAVARLGVDGLAVDIESTTVANPVARSMLLVALSNQLRALFPGWALSAVVPAPVAMDDLAPTYWPGFPWTQLAADYDVWQPMAYVTYRTGALRDAYTYFADNITRVRFHAGEPSAVVAPIGGIADGMSINDVAGNVQACAERGCIGSSLYDYLTTNDALWPTLRLLRSG